MKAATRQTNDQRTMEPALPIRRYIIARKALPVGPGSSVTSPAQTQRTMLRIHPIAYNGESAVTSDIWQSAKLTPVLRTATKIATGAAMAARWTSSLMCAAEKDG